MIEGKDMPFDAVIISRKKSEVQVICVMDMID